MADTTDFLPTHNSVMRYQKSVSLKESAGSSPADGTIF